MVGSAEKCWEDSRNGLPLVSGSGHPVRGGIRTSDDGHEVILLVETSSESTVFGVQGGNNIGVAVSTPTGATREGNRRETALGDSVPRKRTTHL